MRARDLKRNLSLFICLLGAILFFMVGCHVKKPEESATKKSEVAEKKPIKTSTHTITSIDDLKNVISTDMSPLQLVTQAKDMVTNLTLLDISDKNKKELNEILKYLDNIKSPSDYFDDINNIIDFMQTMTRSSFILTEIEPNDFHVNYKAAQQCTNLGYMIESLSQSEKHKLLSDEYKKKGVQASKDLVERFPDEAEGYAQFAFSVIVAEGNKEKAMQLFKRCSELDPESEYCQKNYDDLREDLKSSSP